jgi:hypothetical protein
MLSSNGDGDVHRVGGGATNPAPRSTEGNDDDVCLINITTYGSQNLSPY